MLDTREERENMIVEQVRTSRLRWVRKTSSLGYIHDTLEQAWNIYEEVDGKGGIREEWRVIPVVEEPAPPC